MITPQEHYLKGKVIAQLNLSPGVSDHQYKVAVNEAMAALDESSANIDYTESASDVRRVEMAYLYNDNAENARRVYADNIGFAVQGTVFFQITASPFTRCEALIVQLVNPPARYSPLTP